MRTDSDSWLPPSFEKDGRGSASVTVGELDNLRKQAYSEGFQQGKSEGYQIGLSNAKAEAEQEVNARLAALTQMMEQMKLPLQREIDEVSRTLSELLLKVCAELGSQYAQLNAEITTEIISKLIAELPLNAQNISFRVSPDEIETIQQYWQTHHADKDIQIVADQRISCGGVVVENNEIFLDASIDNRIAQIIGETLGSLNGH